MALLDIVIGAFVGLLIALMLSRLFVSYPKTAALIVLIFAILGLALSDDFLTIGDKRWNIIDKIANTIKTSQGTKDS